MLDFSIKRFCRSIGRAINEVVQDFIFSVVHCSSNVIESLITEIANFGISFFQTFSSSFLIAPFRKNHSERMGKTEGCLYVRIEFKEYLGSFSL